MINHQQWQNWYRRYWWNACCSLPVPQCNNISQP